MVLVSDEGATNLLHRGNRFRQPPCQKVVAIVDPADRVLPTVAVGVGRALDRVADQRLGRRYDFAMDGRISSKG